MSISLKKASIDGALLDVVTYDKYVQHKNLYANTSTAIEMEVDGQQMILPYRNSTDTRPGLYNAGAIDFFCVPEEQNDEYLAEGNNIIDFSDVSNTAQLIEKQAEVSALEKEILMSPDNITKPPISGSETPQMIGFKQSISAKRMDIDKYQTRIGESYTNDKRLLNEDDITFKRLIRMCNATDIDVYLTFMDKEGDIANPMNKEITVRLTRSGEEVDE